MKNIKMIPALLLTLFAYNGCNSDNHTDTPTTGKLTITVDESFKPFIDSEINTFQKIYTYANINANYKPEEEAFNDLLNDTVKLIIVSRSLNKDEKKIFDQWEIVPKETKIAYDAITLIGSRDLKDSVLTLNELKDLLTGKISSKFKNPKIVFDNNSSSTINFLKSITGIKNLSSNCYALNSNEAVIDYVSNGKNSIGFIGVNWISDKNDSTNMNFLKSVKVLELASNDSSESYKPYQAYIALKKYPLWREVYIISKEAYSGLGTGFTAFVASERGQRIILKSGLVPATMPVRLVELKKTDDFYIKQE